MFLDPPLNNFSTGSYNSIFLYFSARFLTILKVLRFLMMSKLAQQLFIIVKVQILTLMVLLGNLVLKLLGLVI
jgi:hypothetical protein